MPEFDVTKQRSLLNWAQIGALIFVVASVSWTLSGIYFRFQMTESEMNTIRDRIEYVNSRIDRKIDPLELRMETLEHLNH
jgi:hypothetical protein